MVADVVADVVAGVVADVVVSAANDALSGWSADDVGYLARCTVPHKRHARTSTALLF